MGIDKFFINIYDIENNKILHEEFESYYFFRKRYMKLKHSKKLKMLSSSNLID